MARTIAPTYRNCQTSITSNRQRRQYETQRQRNSLSRNHTTSTGQYDVSSGHGDDRKTIGGNSVDRRVAQNLPETPERGLAHADSSASVVYQVSEHCGGYKQVALTSGLPERKLPPKPATLVSSVLWSQSDRRREFLYSKRYRISGDKDRFAEASFLIRDWSRSLLRIRSGKAASVKPAPDSLESGFSGKSEQELLSTWTKMFSILDGARLQTFWQRIMLWTLQHDHRKALAFLEATAPDLHQKVGTPRYAIEDALEFLASEYLGGHVASMEMKSRLHGLFCRFAEANYLGNNYISSPLQKIIHSLLRHSDRRQAELLYDAVVAFGLKLSLYTLTQFMHKFTGIGRPDLAMDALRRIADSPVDVSSDAIQYSCIKLLRFPFPSAERYRLQSQLVTEMLETGIRPGIPMLNAMIFNAVDAGDFQTAYAIFETARIHGIRRDTITYSTLLKVALHSLDESLVKKIILMAEEDGALPRNNQLLFCLVTTIMQIAQSSGTEDPSRLSGYQLMLQIYARYCDISPLQELGIWVNPLGNSGGPTPVSQPSPQLISVMILGYLRLCGQPLPMEQLYHRYQGFVAQNHPLIAPIAETEHLANAFLFTLGQNRATFTMCSIILRDMLVPPASTIVKVAKPTIRTWTILLRAYFFNGQRAAGEKIIEMMRAKGVKPNIVTMNTIIAGYAAMHDPTAAVNAMQELELAGFEPDSFTYKGLTRVAKRDELLNALRNVAGKTDQAQEDAQDTEDPTPLENGHVPSPQASRSTHDNSQGNSQEKLLEVSSQLHKQINDMVKATDLQSGHFP
ncbi:MAG: hypothetical protein L6R35_001094 [Caloplaca aegaea]|nr:MAG: hypothetical protein L6R35_001094 [Caloplaca aegaea]